MLLKRNIIIVYTSFKFVLLHKYTTTQRKYKALESIEIHSKNNQYKQL